jgi:hypothetical protein
MLTLVNILIVFFILLIVHQIILANHIIEGLENDSDYKSYDTNNPANALILSQQNAGNIEYIKQRLDTVQGMYQQVQDLSGNVQNLQGQMEQLIEANQQYTTQMVGSTPPEITGTGSESESETDDTSNLVTP